MEGDQLRIYFGQPGSLREIAAWELDDHLRLALPDDTTEWVTAESLTRVLDQAVRMTAKLIVDIEEAGSRHDAGIVELPEFLKPVAVTVRFRSTAGTLRGQRC